MWVRVVQTSVRLHHPHPHAPSYVLCMHAAPAPHSPEPALGGTSLGQLILNHGILIRVIDRQFGKRAFDLMPDTAHSDAENALASLNEIDDLVGAGALVYGCPVAHQRH